MNTTSIKVKAPSEGANIATIFSSEKAPKDISIVLQNL
jgi:hypothetical protein